MNGETEGYSNIDVTKVPGELISASVRDDMTVIDLDSGESTTELKTVTVSADGVFDYAIKQDQETINRYLKGQIDSLNNTYDEQIEPAIGNISTLSEDLGTLSANVGILSGSVETLTGNTYTKTEVDETVGELQEQLQELLLNKVTVTCTSNKSYFYKGYGLSEVKITGGTSAAAGDVEKIIILDSSHNTPVNPAASAYSNNSVTYNTSVSGTSDVQFQCLATFGSKYGGASKSATMYVRAVDPIYCGAEAISVSTSSQANNFAESRTDSGALYKGDSPVSTISGKTVSFNLTDSYNVYVITTLSTLGATDGGFNFPFTRYPLTYDDFDVPYYLYVSQNAYSDGTHVLVFNSNESY